MLDRDFLCWLHERLEYVYGENPNVDFMHKLRAIIRDTDPYHESRNTLTCGSLENLKETFGVRTSNNEDE